MINNEDSELTFDLGDYFIIEPNIKFWDANYNFNLKGKKVAVTFGSTGDAWLLQALKEVNLTRNDVERINTRPPSLVSVLDTGSVDALVAWEPFNYRALKKISGSKVIKRGGDLVCFCAYLHGNPDRVYKD